MVVCGSMVFGSSSCNPRMPMASASLRSPRSGVCAAAKIPMPPLNPRDPFLSRLTSVAAKAPESLLESSVNSGDPPYLDLVGVPKLMATPAQVEHSVSYNEHRSRKPPPDLPSLLLHGRIVYIGMPLVPAVTELVIAELLYLQWMDPNQPIYVYINSTGTTRDDGRPVAMDYEGFAIYDTMMQIKNEVHTVGLGAAIGHACLLLASGKKGRRFMMTHAKAAVDQPRIPPTGLLQASDVINRANEVVLLRDTFYKLLAKHTGNSFEEIKEMTKWRTYMNSAKAKSLGFVDKILERGKDSKMIANVASPEDWDRTAGVKGLDDY